MKCVFSSVFHRTFVVTTLFLFMLVATFSTLTYAGEIETKPISGISSTTSSAQSFAPGVSVDHTGIEQPDIPSVSIDQAATLVETKINDIVIFFQVIAKPLCILVGVISAMMSLLGIFGDSTLLYRGLVGLVLASLCYFGIQYAPELIAFINGWMSEGTEPLLSQSL